MNCPKEKALTAAQMALMEGTHLMRSHGKEAEGLVENLMYIYEYLKERPCPGEKP